MDKFEKKLEKKIEENEIKVLSEVIKKQNIIDTFDYSYCEYEFQLVNQHILGCKHPASITVDIKKCGKECPFYSEKVAKVTTYATQSTKK